MADLQDQISQARSSGYNDDDIVNYLSSKPDLGDKIKTAKGHGYSSKDILGYLQTAQTTTPSIVPSDVRGTSDSPSSHNLGDQPASVGGVLGTMATQAKDAVEGVGAGVASTAAGAMNLGHKIFSAIPAAPDFLQRAGAPVQYTRDAQGNETPVAPSGAFQMGRTGEQVGEFFLPGDAVNAGAKLAEGARAGMVGKILGTSAKAIGEAASAGGVAALQSGGDTDAMARAALTAGAASGAFSTIGGLLKAVPLDKLYLSRLKIPARFSGARTDDILNMAIDEGILISKSGSDKIDAIQNMQKADRDAAIQPYLNQTVDVNVVAAPLQKLRTMADSLGETNLVNQIDKRLDKYLNAKGQTAAVPAQTTTSAILGPNGVPITSTIPAIPAQPARITVRQAIQDKNELQGLAANFFGKFSEGKGQIRKLLSAGINDAIEQISPAYREANKDIQTSKLLKNAIDKYVDSSAGTFLNNPRMALMAIWNTPAALAYGALASPFVRSALAIGGSRVADVPGMVGTGVGRVMAQQDPFGPVPKEQQ